MGLLAMVPAIPKVNIMYEYVNKYYDVAPNGTTLTCKQTGMVAESPQSDLRVLNLILMLLESWEQTLDLQILEAAEVLYDHPQMCRDVLFTIPITV